MSFFHKGGNGGTGVAAPVDLTETRGVGIRIEALNKRYGANHVLKDLTLEIRAGETFSIIGPSGTGKSVLLKLIVRLDVPDSGQIYIDDRPLFAADGTVVDADWFRCSMVFQSSALFNSLTVGENVGLWLRDKRICPEQSIRRIVAEKLALVGLEGKEGLKSSELSGGMKKRVAIARSLVRQPRLLLLDEPTSALDASVQAEILNLLVELKERLGTTYLLVSHDLGVISHMCDRVAVMQQGRLVETLSEADLAQGAARHPYSAELFHNSILPLVIS